MFSQVIFKTQNFRRAFSEGLAVMQSNCVSLTNKNKNKTKIYIETAINRSIEIKIRHQ